MDLGNSVYIYNGVVETPGDIGDALTPPFTTANVAQNVDGIYVFEVNFLSIGEYSAAFTCQASIDDPEVDDDIAFSAPQTFMIDDGVTTPIVFDPPPPPP